MGKRIKYHRFSYKKDINFIIAETSPKNYFWLSIYLDKKLRNQTISKEIITFLLYTLKGTHEIHWNKGLKTLNQLAKNNSWTLKSKSEVFEDCQYTITKSFNNYPKFLSLFKVILEHKIVLNCPHLKNYRSPKDIKLVLKTIMA